ncbi:hypothetical protein pdul_cds_518 [Pandoravirus dulcis]|uniref:Uncharacterized protein n=1 Tax=Pandoravirus dulcis TaxID=1349409 RepID=S4VT72_9VIRU|nr:hypothetical protein pdul_cds_518 [Pandoravirus dulcis]AGO82610.1 hypothetical protein pdul_cds_518 [Pandoravirus dulcis]
MALKRAGKTTAEERPRAHVRGTTLVFATAGVLCLFVAATVLALWYADSLGHDVALAARVTGADCLVLEQTPSQESEMEHTGPPRVRFYAPAAREWIEATLSLALGHRPRPIPALAWASFSTRHPAGNHIPCYYDPDDPGAAVALSARVNALYSRLLACGTMVSVLWAIGTISLGLAVANMFGCARCDDGKSGDGDEDDAVDLEAATPPRGWGSRWRLVDVVLAE